MYKEQLASIYNLTLEEVEWVQAFSDTLQAFSTRPINEQHIILMTLCGEIENPCSIVEVTTLWTAENVLSASQVLWLINGLSEKSAADKLMKCLEGLEHQYQEDLHRLADNRSDLMHLEQSVEQKTQSPNHTSQQYNLESISTPNPIEYIEQKQEQKQDLTPILPRSNVQGHLIVRIHNPYTNTWSYCNIETGTIEILSDKHTEEPLLKRWASQFEDGLACAVLSIEWNLANLNSGRSTGISRTVEGANLHSTVSTSYTPSMLSESHEQSGILHCHGGLLHDTVIPTINIPKRTLSIGIQRLSHWLFELIDLGPTEPGQMASTLQWDLTYSLNQTLSGNGNRGGRIHLRNSHFVQVSDQNNTWLGGTSPTAETIPLPTTGGEHTDSRQQRWNGTVPVALKKHCVHEEYEAKPIFNQTPPFNNQVEREQRIQGIGNTLHLWSFLEQSSKAWHEDSSQRTQLEFKNQTHLTILGTFIWNDHVITLSEDGSITLRQSAQKNRHCVVFNTPTVREQHVTESLLYNTQHKNENDSNEYTDISIVRKNTSWKLNIQD